MFGFKDQKKSTFRKVSQTFDKQTDVHVIVIECRVRKGGDGVVAKKQYVKREIRKLELLSQLVAQAKLVKSDKDSPNPNIPPKNPVGQQLIVGSQVWHVAHSGPVQR